MRARPLVPLVFLACLAGCSEPMLLVDDSGPLHAGTVVEAKKPFPWEDGATRLVTANHLEARVPVALLAPPRRPTPHAMWVVSPTTPLLTGPAGDRRVEARFPAGWLVHVAEEHVIDDLALSLDKHEVVRGRVPLSDLVDAPDPMNPEPVFQAALAALQARDPALALARAEGVLRTKPEHAGAAEIVGTLVRDDDPARSRALLALVPPRPAVVVPPKERVPVDRTGFVVEPGLAGRQAADPSSRIVRDLPIGTPVLVVGATRGAFGDWAEVEVTTDPDANTGNQQRCFVPLDALDTFAPDGALLAAEGRAAIARGELPLAVALLRRAWALGEDVAEPLFDAALSAHLYGAAAEAARPRVALPRAPDVDVELRTFWGCRGNPLRAVRLEKADIEGLLSSSAPPTDACLQAPDVALCLERSDCNRSEHKPGDLARLKALRKILPRPVVVATIHNRTKDRLVGRWQTFRTRVDWEDGFHSRGTEAAELDVGALEPRAFRQVWWPLPGDEDAFVGLSFGDGDVVDLVDRETKLRAARIDCATNKRRCDGADALRAPPGRNLQWSAPLHGPVCTALCEDAAVPSPVAGGR
jgi:hypothetical protein